METHRPGFQPENLPLDNSSRAKRAIYVFGLIMISNFMAICAIFYQNVLFRRYDGGGGVSDQEFDLSDSFILITAIVQFLIYITSVFLFLYWFRRAYTNLERIEESLPNTNNNMAVWSFFIPIANLFKPYYIMEEVWEKTQELIARLREDFRVDYSNLWVRLWWAFFFVGKAAQQYAFRVEDKAVELSQYITANNLYILASLVEIVSAWVVLVLIAKISEFESILFREIQFLKSTKSPAN